MSTKFSDKLFYRSFELDRSKVNEDARSVELSFSSEAPVVRWFGQEVLLHGEANVDLKRLRSMGSALLNHNPDRIVGRVDNPRIEDKRGAATVVFDEDEDGERAFGKVKSRSLRGVSVGYAINAAKKLQEGEEWRGYQGPAIIATRWTPYEISLTPVPADSSIGIGREMTRSLDGIEIEGSDFPNNQLEVRTMTNDYLSRNQPLLDPERQGDAKLFLRIANALRPGDVEFKCCMAETFLDDLCRKDLAYRGTIALVLDTLATQGGQSAPAGRSLEDDAALLKRFRQMSPDDFAASLSCLTRAESEPHVPEPTSGGERKRGLNVDDDTFISSFRGR